MAYGSARRAIETGGMAGCSLAVELGALHEQKNAAELILIGFVHDEDEYVSRRALLSLAKMKSDRTESLVERAWGTGHLYQRIAALSTLQTVSSKKLREYVEKAYENGREYVVQNARKIESA